MAASKNIKRDWQVRQRQRRFRDLYLSGVSVREAATAAGYSPSTVESSYFYKLAATFEETLRDQCELVGIGKLGLVRKLQALLEAKEPRWNAKTETWDYFENTTAQLAAYDRLKAIIEPEVPKPALGNVKLGVRVAAEASDAGAWIERNKGKVAEARQSGAFVEIQLQVGTAGKQTEERARPAGDGERLLLGDGSGGDEGPASGGA